MKIAIVGGTAGLGYALGVRFASSGDEVVIGSRKSEKGVMAADAIRTAAGSQATVSGGENAQAVVGADAVFVTVPFPGLAETYETIKSQLKPGTTVVDCNVPLASEVGGKPTRMLGIWEGSAAQMAKGILGKEFHVASGFHTVMAAKLEKHEQPLEQDVLVAGDRESREIVKSLVERIEGARFVDCGPLEMARVLESLTALIIGINVRYKLDPGAGIRIEGL